MRRGNVARLLTRALLPCALVWGSGCGETTDSQHAADPDPVRTAIADSTDGLITRARVPDAPAPEFAGSERCAECHEDIVRRYQSHPMSRSAHRVTPGSRGIPNDGEAVFETAAGRVHGVSWDADQMRHFEAYRDAAGTMNMLQSVPIDFSIGSGERGYSYLTQHGQTLYMSPLTWYTESQQWDLSPGYDPQDHPRFSRRVSDGCVTCHIGITIQKNKKHNRFQSPAFAELSIACERCHGSGVEHVALHTQGSVAADRDPIVNPADLDPSRRDSVCYQCHLHGVQRIVTAGRTEYTFRPGEVLTDNWTVLVSAGHGGRTREAVSHVEQLRTSACFRGSQGRLACTSCHDPHFRPDTSVAAAWYTRRCLSCHDTDASCSLPVDERFSRQSDGSCIACHMPDFSASDVPHTAQTDHRILRRYPDAADRSGGTAPDRLELFATDAFPVRPEEAARAWAIEHARQAGQSLSENSLLRAMRKLDEALRLFPGDTTLLEHRAAVLFDLGRHSDAEQVCEQVLKIDRENETALELKLQIHLTRGNWQAAADISSHLVAIDAFSSINCERRAYALNQLGRQTDAIQAAQRALEIDPFLHETRRGLVGMLLESGDQESAATHMQFLRKFDRRN